MAPSHISWTSLCSLSCMEVVLGYRTQMSVFSDILFFHQPGWVSDLHGDVLSKVSTKYETVSSLEALLGYKRQPVQTPYPSLIAVLSRVTIINFRKFQLHYVFTLPSWNVPQISAMFPCTYYLHPSLAHGSFHIPYIVTHNSPKRIYSVPSS